MKGHIFVFKINEENNNKLFQGKFTIPLNDLADNTIYRFCKIDRFNYKNEWLLALDDCICSYTSKISDCKASEKEIENMFIEKEETKPQEEETPKDYKQQQKPDLKKLTKNLSKIR